MKLDLFKQQWLDMVFEGRNKKYGAYELRKENSKVSMVSLFIGVGVFAFGVFVPRLIDMLPDGSDDESLDQKITTVDLTQPEKKEEVKIEEKKPEPPKPKIDEVKFIPPKVVEAKEVKEELKTVEELKDKTISDKDQKGDENAKVTIDQPTGDNDKAAEVVDNTVYSSAGLEVQPEFQGGMQAFYKYCAKNYKTEDIAEKLNSDLTGKVFVEFVVEKDGSLTDIKVVRDLGYGTGQEAIRMLKTVPRWTPGEQNGKKVRARYVLPISISIGAAGE
ncbi:MAG: energy transducer TonB [Limnohabitans sp.]|nr:energy transducer TonB [Limnohabitans sp.]